MHTLNRRNMLATAGLLAVAAAARAQPASSPAASSPAASPQPVPAALRYPFTLPPLPYAPAANEPSIDAETMSLHHDKHHAAYVTNLNAALKDYPALHGVALGDMLARLGDVPEPIRAVVRNNGGGHVNHSMFWQVMGGHGGDPAGELATAINASFGSLAALKTRFNAAGLGQFGSGWAMVVLGRGGVLQVEARPNQDSPMMDGARVVFGNDVWEHAYYLRYQNRRADYLQAWWNTLDWARIGERYAAAKAGTLAS